MEEKLKCFAVITSNLIYGDKLCQDLHFLCRDNGCNFLFCVFQNIDAFNMNDQKDIFTHIIIVSAGDGMQKVDHVRKIRKDVVIMLLTSSHEDMHVLFHQRHIYCAPLPDNKKDLADIMDMLYGSRKRFLSGGRDIRIMSLQKDKGIHEGEVLIG